MNNISDKNVIIIFIVTVLFVFSLVFSVKSPERKTIDEPLMWKDDYINSSNNNQNFKQSEFYSIKI